MNESIKTTILENIFEGIFYLLLVLLPFQTRYFFIIQSEKGYVHEYGSFTLYATQILIVLCFVLLFIMKKRHLSLKSVLRSKIILTFCFFCLYLVFVASISQYSIFSMYWIMSFVFASLFGFLIVFSRIPISRIFFMLSTGVAIQSLLAIVQFFAQRVEAFKWLGIAAHTPFFLGDSVVWVEQGRVLRAYGGLPHPNILGGWLVVGSLLSIAAIVKAKSKKIRFSLLVMYVFILIGLFFTFSKSAWIAFIVALTLLGAWVYAFHGNLLEQKARTIFTQIFAVTAVFFVLFPFLYRDMIVSRVSPFQLQQNHLEQRSYLERYASMKEAFSLLKQHLFLGVGPGAYTHALRYYFEPKALYELQPVHNVALLQTVELGVVGFFVWVFFVFFIVQKIVKEGSIYSIILLSPILPLSLFDHYLWSMYPGLILLAIMFASSIGFSRKKISSYGG